MNDVEQKEIDAIGARILHKASLSRLRRWSTVADVLALAVPIVYMTFRYLAKGTPLAGGVENLWELLAAALLVIIVIKLVGRWPDKAEQHSRLIGENISLITQARALRRKPQPLSDDTVYAFSLLADSIEKQDHDSLSGMPADERKNAYREALKEFGGPDVECPVCHASPWFYTKGTCEACGNRKPTDKGTT